MIEERNEVMTGCNVVTQGIPAIEDITLEELEDELTFLNYAQGKEQFILTEDFPKHKKRSLYLDNLKIEIEDSYEDPFIMLCDVDHMILNNGFVSAMFLNSSVEKITKETLADTEKFTIVFDNGTIEIQ